MIFDTFNNVSVIYHSFALGSGFRSLMFYATLNIVSVIYQTFALGRGWGDQEAHVLCHFQYCFSYLPHLCCRLGVSRIMFFATFNNVSVIYHTFAVGWGT
jgi:hypothetical protein